MGSLNKMESSKNVKLLLSFISAFSTVSIIFQLVNVPRVVAGDTIACASDRPCINEAYQSGNKVIFGFNVIRDWDYYNVRYPISGGEKQVENRSGKFTFNNVQPNRVYRISVQGCNKHFLGRSTCSPWVSQSFTTR